MISRCKWCSSSSNPQWSGQEHAEEHLSLIKPSFQMFPEEISIAFFPVMSVFSAFVDFVVFNKHVWTDLDLKFVVSVVKMTCFGLFFIHFSLFLMKYSTVCYYCEDNKDNMKEDRFSEEVGINFASVTMGTTTSRRRLKDFCRFHK